MTGQRFTDEDRAVMLRCAAALGDRDGLDAVRLGLAHDPAGRSCTDVLAPCLWAVDGLVIADLRESEWEWVMRHLPDAYWTALTEATT